MRVTKVYNCGPKVYKGWLEERFGDHYAQISIDSTLKLRSAVRDVTRMRKGFIPPDIEAICKRFKMPPQGISDYDFVMGYDTDEGRVPGSIESGHAEADKALQQYAEQYPDDWDIVKKCLGLGRQKGRHACLPAGELVAVKGQKCVPVPIEECDGKEVYTGQDTRGPGYSPHAKAKLLDQGVREVWEYTLSNGKKLRCTPDHRLLTTDGWMAAHDAFRLGTEIVKSNAKIKLTADDAINYASLRHGELVKWGGTASSYSQWRCVDGHTWTAPFGRMYSYEYWCRKCSHANRFVKRKNVSARRQASKQLSTYRRYDKQKGLETDLEVEDVIKARRSSCVYCGRPATGLERIDNDVGHTKSNCAPACLRCNWMRGRYVSHAVMLEVGKTLARVDP